MEQQGSHEMHQPTERGDVDRRATGQQQARNHLKTVKSTETIGVCSDWSWQRKRKFPDGKKVWKQNKNGVREDFVTIVSADYDYQRSGWMYTLKDGNGQLIGGKTPETLLG
ncbi:hypothetical protein ACLMJK_004366 [Lecanora helva]